MVVLSVRDMELNMHPVTMVAAQKIVFGVNSINGHHAQNHVEVEFNREQDLNHKRLKMEELPV